MTMLGSLSVSLEVLLYTFCGDQLSSIMPAVIHVKCHYRMKKICLWERERERKCLVKCLFKCLCENKEGERKDRVWFCCNNLRIVNKHPKNMNFVERVKKIKEVRKKRERKEEK